MKSKLWDLLPWVLVAILVVTGFLLAAEHREATREARAADMRAQIADERRMEAAARARRDSARLDSVRGREAAVRDSLRRLMARAEAESEEASDAVDLETVALDSTLAELARRVPDRLVGLVTQAMRQADSLQQAHGRYRAAMEARVGLLARDTASLARELDSTRQTLGSTRSALHETEGALQRMTAARDKWRAAADPGLWSDLFGGDLLSAVGTVGGGVAAFAWDEKAGAGYVGAVVVRGLF